MPGSANSICHIPIVTSTHHMLTMKAVLHFKWVNYYLPSKRWKVKEQLTLTTSHFHFSSHLVLWPSRNYYPYSVHLFHLLTTQISGCHNHAITQSWKISYWNHIFLSHYSHVMCHQTPGTHSCWLSLLYHWNEQPVQLIQRRFL